MTKRLDQFPSVSYRGSSPMVPVGLCKPFDRAGPRTVPLTIDWALYGASTANSKVGVKFDLAGLAAQGVLDAIRSVYVDNTFSNNTIYVYFPSTGFTVPVPANSVVMSPVLSTDQNVIVYGEDFYTGLIPITQVLLSNTPSDGYSIEAKDVTNLQTVMTYTAPVGAPGGFTTAIGVGAPTADRILVMCLSATGAGTDPGITTANMNGKAMTRAVQQLNTSLAAYTESAIFYINEPAGATGALNVSRTVACAWQGISVFAVYGATALAPLSTGIAPGIFLPMRTVPLLQTRGAAVFGVDTIVTNVAPTSLPMWADIEMRSYQSLNVSVNGSWSHAACISDQFGPSNISVLTADPNITSTSTAAAAWY